MRGYLVRFLSFIALFGLALTMLPANAGGVGISITTPTNGEIDSAASTGFATTTISWTSSATYLNGATVQLALAPVPSSTAITECLPATTSIGGATYTFGSASSSGAVWTLTGNAATTAVTLCVLVPVTNGPALISAKNFSEAIVTTGATVDFGAAMFYVNGGNDVTITATVPATLSFMITDPANINLEQHTCNLGNLSMSAVNSCSYRLKIQTNAQNGFGAKIKEDHDLATGYATITNVADLHVTAGFEEYGVNLVTSTYGGRNPNTGLFTEPATAWHPIANDYSIPTLATGFVSSTNAFYATSTGATQLVTHKASINGATVVGSYSQRVTYYVYGHF
ncbi:MAG: hypothetical protein PHC53_03270 [Patescibacteria group bacterium]|nr:hypothetical protein [Patescibacteria group bacterium]